MPYVRLKVGENQHSDVVGGLNQAELLRQWSRLQDSPGLDIRTSCEQGRHIRAAEARMAMTMIFDN